MNTVIPSKFASLKRLDEWLRFQVDRGVFMARQAIILGAPLDKTGGPVPCPRHEHGGWCFSGQMKLILRHPRSSKSHPRVDQLLNDISFLQVK